MVTRLFVPRLFAHRSENSTEGMKGPRSESSKDFSFPGTSVPLFTVNLLVY